MIYPEADKLEKWGSKYALVTLAAKRAKQLKAGAPSTISSDSRNPLTVALEEIASGKITCFVPDVDIVATSSVEPEVAELLAIPQESEADIDLLEVTSTTLDDELILEDEESEDEEDLEIEEEVEEDATLVRPDDWEDEIEEEEHDEDEPDDELISAADMDTGTEALAEPKAEDELKPKARRGRKPKAVAEEVEEVEEPPVGMGGETDDDD